MRGRQRSTTGLVAQADDFGGGERCSVFQRAVPTAEVQLGAFLMGKSWLLEDREHGRRMIALRLNVAFAIRPIAAEDALDTHGSH